MNDNAKQWVKELRSGKYKQGQDFLRSKNGFCCLGVACDLYAKTHPKTQWDSTVHSSVFYFGGENLYLPEVVMEWLGLKTRTGTFAFGSLTGMNDAGRKFNAIAKTIESEPAGLFEKEEYNALPS